MTITGSQPAQQTAPPMLASMPPHHQLLFLTVLKVVPRAVWALAKLGVADHLTAGPRPVAELAAAVDADVDALYRVLRCAAAFGVFQELPDGRIALTPSAEHLRSNVPGSMRDMVVLHGEDILWQSYGEMLHTLRTGEPAFDRVFGTSFFKYLDANPEASAVFHRAMTGANKGNPDVLTGLMDLSSVACVADLGGGEGTFLAELLTRYPGCRGVLFDRADAIAPAAGLFERRGLTDRVTTLAGDFFISIPPGYDAYVLKQVLHDWTDEQALRILRNVRTAMGEHDDSRLFIVERLVGTSGGADLVALLDIDMLVAFGGRERSLVQWRRLADESGLEVVAAPTHGPWSAIECRPR